MAITTCPKCGYVRKTSDTNSEWQCPACGIAYAKYSNQQIAAEYPNAPITHLPAEKSGSRKKITAIKFLPLALVCVLVLGYQFVSDLFYVSDSIKRTTAILEAAIKIKHENATWGEEVLKTRSANLQKLSLQIANESVALSAKKTIRITHPILHQFSIDYMWAAARLIIVSESAEMTMINAAQATLISDFVPSDEAHNQELDAARELVAAVTNEMSLLTYFSDLNESRTAKTYAKSNIIDDWIKEQKREVSVRLDFAKKVAN